MRIFSDSGNEFLLALWESLDSFDGFFSAHPFALGTFNLNFGFQFFHAESPGTLWRGLNDSAIDLETDPLRLQPLGLSSLTLRIATIAAEIAAAGVLKLSFAFRADADHGGHDGAGDVGCAGG